MQLIGRTSTIALLCITAVACSPSPAQPDDIEDDVAEQPGDTPRLAIPDVDSPSFSDEAPDAEELADDGDVTSFRVGEVDVVHMPTPANEVVSARLYLRGGSANFDDPLQGIERLALAVATNGGTESTPKDEFNARLDAVGSSIGFTTNRDYSGYTMRSVRDHFDETWDLFEQSIFEPAFDDSEVELRRDRQIASIQSIVDNPDRLVSEVARDLTFADHPYAYRQLGTQESVSQFSTDELRQWHQTLLAPERMLLVVVGNIDRDELVDKVQQRLGRLEPTGAEVPSLPGIDHDAPALRVEQLDVPTNYILGYYAAPTIGHPDYPALVMATRHLRDRLFEEVRTKRNLTYSVSSNVGQRGDNVGFLYVSAVDPQATIPVMFDEVTRLQNETIDDEQLEKVRNVYLTGHYMDQETNSSIAGQLGRAELIGGDWRRSRQFVDDIMEVTPEDIRRVAETYMSNYQFGVVGDPDEVPAELFGIDDGHVETVDEVDDVDPEQLDDAAEPEPEPEPQPEGGEPM